MFLSSGHTRARHLLRAEDRAAPFLEHIMKKILNRTLTAAAVSGLFPFVGMANLPIEAQYSLIGQPGQPSQAPRPTNPQPGTPSQAPRPTNPQPGQPSEAPRPSNPNSVPPRPTPPGTNEPVQPGTDTRDNQPVRPIEIDDGRDGTRTSNNGMRYTRPFAFQIPEGEARFNESARRLVTMEEKLDRTNQDLLRRLGEVRSMPADRQNAAILDLLQQVLLHNKSTQQYLVHARTAWAGEFEMENADDLQNSDGARQLDGRQNRQPEDQPDRQQEVQPNVQPNTQSDAPVRPASPR
jgi:hypothetical protein